MEDESDMQMTFASYAIFVLMTDQQMRNLSWCCICAHGRYFKNLEEVFTYHSISASIQVLQAYFGISELG